MAGTAERVQHLFARSLILVLAHLHLAHEARDPQPDADRASCQLSAELLVEGDRPVDVLLEVVDEPSEDPQVLVGVQDLGNAVSVGDDRQQQAIAFPVRIVWGTGDRLLPWPSAAVRFRHEWLPRADWVELDGVGHSPQLDVPLEAAQLILGFTAD